MNKWYVSVMHDGDKKRYMICRKDRTGTVAEVRDEESAKVLVDELNREDGNGSA